MENLVTEKDIFSSDTKRFKPTILYSHYIHFDENT